jgi:cobalt-zinc-cadmium efflux system protein
LRLYFSRIVDNHSHAPIGYNRAFAIGIALNLGFVAVEAFYGWRVGSLALLADAGHNLSDVAGLVLAWMAFMAGRLTPDRRHTYGWRRASIMAAFANAILLLVAMGSLAWEAVSRLNTPTPTEGHTIIAVAAAGIVVNGITAALFMAGRSADLNIRGAFIHMAADALVSLGVVVAGALYLWTGWNWLDPVTSLVIAVVIVFGTWGLFKQSLRLLFDGVPESVDLLAVQDFLLSRPGVEGIHDLHVWAMSTSDIALTAHLVMPDGHPGDAFFREIETALHDRYEITHSTIQIDISRLDHGCAVVK